MSRRLKLHTIELGPIELFLIYSYTTIWEAEWQSMQGHPIAALFTTVPKETLDHALYGWTSPLVKALGLSPEGALRKLPFKARTCGDVLKCPHHDRVRCQPTSKDLPWCFTPGGIQDEVVRVLANEVVRLWHEKVYVVVVEEKKDG